MPLIPARGGWERQRQVGHCDFKASLVYMSFRSARTRELEEEEPDVRVGTYNLSTWEVEAAGPRVQGYP